MGKRGPPDRFGLLSIGDPQQESAKKLPIEVGLPLGLDGGVKSPLDPMLKLPTDMALFRIGVPDATTDFVCGSWDDGW